MLSNLAIIDVFLEKPDGCHYKFQHGISPALPREKQVSVSGKEIQRRCLRKGCRPIDALLAETLSFPQCGEALAWQKIMVLESDWFGFDFWIHSSPAE